MIRAYDWGTEGFAAPNLTGNGRISGPPADMTGYKAPVPPPTQGLTSTENNNPPVIVADNLPYYVLGGMLLLLLLLWKGAA